MSEDFARNEKVRLLEIEKVRLLEICECNPARIWAFIGNDFKMG